MTDAPQPRAGILSIAPYVPGRAGVDGERAAIKLSSNESALGPSPKALAAYHAASAQGLHRYPEGTSADLRQALAKRFGLHAERLICGAGSDELLHLITLCYVGPGDEVVMSRHGFLVYELATKTAGGTIVKAEERDLKADVDALLAAVTPKTKVVFLANPNNPTGSYVTQAELKRLHAGLPKHVLLVVDAAYAEFVRRNDYDAGIDLAASSNNVIMTRTFSKVFGLAGLRLGWAFGPAQVIDAMNRVRGPFNVAIPAQAAGIAALEDESFLDQAITHNLKELERVTAALLAMKLEVAPSVGNFLLVKMPGTPGLGASEIEAKLAERGVMVRAVKAYDLPDHLRFSIGLAEENDALLAALAEILARP